MNCVVVPEALWPSISHVDPAGRESAGIALAGAVSAIHGGSKRLLVRSVALPGADDYLGRTNLGTVLSPGFVAATTAEARRLGLSTVFFHTHPFEDAGAFSAIDYRGELELAEFLARRIPNVPHAAVVLGRKDHAVRQIGGDDDWALRVVGADVREWNRLPEEAEAVSQTYDRQVRVFGPSAQRRLARLRVAVVGLGGTGSIVAQELAHLGVRNFLLLDPDVVDETNLNRVVGAESTDAAHSPKVEVAARMIRRINPEALVEPVCGDATFRAQAERLRGFDAIFGCTDSHGSRYVLNQLAYQYLVPVFDVGVAIVGVNGLLTHVFGRAQMLSAGLPCLICGRTLDPEQVRRDMMTEFERQSDPYVAGGGVPQPAVVSLNGTVSSLVVTMFLSAFAGVPVEARHQVYDATRGVVRAMAATANSVCVACSSDGAFARGDSWPVPGRTA